MRCKKIKNQIEIRNNLNLDEWRTKKTETNIKNWIQKKLFRPLRYGRDSEKSVNKKSCAVITSDKCLQVVHTANS